MKLCFGSACVNGVGECPKRQASENHYPGTAAGMLAPPTTEGTLQCWDVKRIFVLTGNEMQFRDILAGLCSNILK